MGVYADLINTTFRDFKVDGDPSSGVHHPAKKGVRDAFAALADATDSVAAKAAEAAASAELAASEADRAIDNAQAQVDAATAEADRATTQADRSTTQADLTEERRVAADVSATEAMNAAIAAGAKIYANTNDGLADPDTIDGDLFFVPDGLGNLILYLNDAGTAVEQQRTAFVDSTNAVVKSLRANQPQRSGNLAVHGGLKADYNPGRPLVSFIDDDAHERVYSYLYPILVDKGIPFGLATPSNTLGNAGKLTLAQLREIVEATGTEVLSHTYDEKGLVSTLGGDPVAVEFELRESKKQLESYGFVVDGFVPVGGQDSVSIRAQIDEHYAASYVTQGANNALPFIVENSVKRQQFAATSNGGSTLQYYKDIVDQAVANNEWVVFTTHVGIVPAYQDANHDTWLPQLIDYIQSLGVEIVAPRDGLAEFGQVIRQERSSEGTYFRLDKSGRLQSSDVDAKYVQYDDSRAFDAGLNEYPMKRATVAVYNQSGLPSPGGPRGTLITHRPSDILSWTEYGWQEWRHGFDSKAVWKRNWLQSDPEGPGTWSEWSLQAPHAGATLSVTDTPADIRARVGDSVFLVTSSYSGTAASAAGLPTYGFMVTRLGGGGYDYNTSQTFYAHDNGSVYDRRWNSSAGVWTDWLAENIIKHHGQLNFGTVAAQSTKSLTLPVSGAVTGSTVTINLSSAMPSGVIMAANCYSNGVVTVEATNVQGVAVTTYTKDIYLKIDTERG